MLREAIALKLGQQEYQIGPLLFVAGWIYFFNEVAPVEGRAPAWQSQKVPLAAYNGSSDRPALYSVESLCTILSEADHWKLAGDPGFVERNAAMIALGEDGRVEIRESLIAEWLEVPTEVRTVLLAQVEALAFPVLVAHGN